MLAKSIATYLLEKVQIHKKGLWWKKSALIESLPEMPGLVTYEPLSIRRLWRGTGHGEWWQSALSSTLDIVRRSYYLLDGYAHDHCKNNFKLYYYIMINKLPD